MSDHFDAFITIEFSIEGVYSNNLNDNGKETKWGVARGKHPEITDAAWAAWTKDDSQALIRSGYWDKNRLGELPWAWALCIGDGEVNQGSVIKLAQDVLGLRKDGVIGDQTIAAILNATDEHLDLFMAHRAHSYVADNLFPKDWAGWFKRLFQIRALAATSPNQK